MSELIDASTTLLSPETALPAVPDTAPRKNTFLDDDGWDNLLRQIRLGQVIPLIGPNLVTARDEANKEVPLFRLLAPKLAKALKLRGAEKFTNLNEVVRAHLLAGRERTDVYAALGVLIDRLDAKPGPALLELAAITDFKLFITSTPDPLLAKAVAQQRSDFQPREGTISFHPNGNSRRTCDLPKHIESPIVYHILGNHQTFPDFAIWEEDYMEFICGLQAATGTLENLFSLIKHSNLLLLGAPSEDWIVRFFLRVVRQQRLSERPQRDYLSDRPELLGKPMTFFFDKAVKATHIIQGSPAEFALQLAERWRESSPAASSDAEFLRRLPAEMPQGSVFISYSHDNSAEAIRLARDLAAAGVPVWLDKQRLEAGQNWHRGLEQAVKDACSFFISLVSAATEGDRSRFVHKERQWAASRHVDGFVFYIPVVLDLPRQHAFASELDNFAAVEKENVFQCLQRTYVAEGSRPEFVRKMRGYVDHIRLKNCRPRD
jgi:hypothetical protein